jgi:hypothetical protein
MFCFISKNWRGRPLISVETVIELISNTTTSKGLKIVCVKDENTYELGTKITDEEFAELNITRDVFHGDWNYIISPKHNKLLSYSSIVLADIKYLLYLLAHVIGRKDFSLVYLS